MSFRIQYIPLSKIKPDLSVKMTQHIKKLRSVFWDCMYLLAVRKNKKDGNYIIVSGIDRYEYLQKHTNKKYAPCIVEEVHPASQLRPFFQRLRNRRLLYFFPNMNLNRIAPSSLSILRTFLKQEPRMAHLTRSQQIKVLLLGIRYKKTVVLSMKTMVNDLLSR